MGERYFNFKIACGGFSMGGCESANLIRRSKMGKTFEGGMTRYDKVNQRVKSFLKKAGYEKAR
jgi:hypothetical protein